MGVGGWARKILPRCVLLRCQWVGMGNPKGGGGRWRWGRGKPEFCPGRMPSSDPRAGLGRLTTLFLGLVGAVPTVVLSITLPACRDAAA